MQNYYKAAFELSDCPNRSSQCIFTVDRYGLLESFARIVTVSKAMAAEDPVECVAALKASEIFEHRANDLFYLGLHRAWADYIVHRLLMREPDIGADPS